MLVPGVVQTAGESAWPLRCLPGAEGDPAPLVLGGDFDTSLKP